MDRMIAIAAVALVVGVLYYIFGYTPTVLIHTNKARPDDAQKPTKPVENDKIIVVSNLKFKYLKKVIEQFCNICNQQTFSVLPRVFILDKQYAITFPYNIDFDKFCYFINYFENAHEVGLLPEYKPEVKGWCTTKTEDKWITSDTADKKVMIYIPEWDEEYDNVFLTTQDNLCVKFVFALRGIHQKMENPALPFIENPIDLKRLGDMEGVEFE